MNASRGMPRPLSLVFGDEEAPVAAATFSPLTDKERQWVAQQIDGARKFVAVKSPADADQPMTLEALDRAFAVWLPQSGSDGEQINAVINVVGVQFGQFLVEWAGFEWTIAADEQGTDLAVLALPGRGDVLVYPANFVAKRWVRRESNFLAASFEAIRKQVDAVQAGAGGGERRPWWRFW
jgi:hypothetical protein